MLILHLIKSNSKTINSLYLYLESAYPLSRDELTVIQFDPLEGLARHQVLEACVRHQGAVVKFQHAQLLRGTGARTQVTDTLVRD